MPIGGPVSFAEGFLGGFAKARERASAKNRQQLQMALRLQAEMRQGQEAIAKENLNLQKAQAQAAQAKSELDLLEQRKAQIMASPGAPFKDAALEGHLEEARERMEDAHSALQESQGKLQDLVADRDARVRAAIPNKTGGFLGFGQRDLTSDERKQAIRAGETANTPENRGFAQSTRETQRDIGKETALEKRERAKASGYEKAIETGQSQQGAVNEEKRQAQIYPLDKQAAEQRTKQLEARSAMQAAAQEIQARQQQQQFLQQQAPRYGGGAATGKGGGSSGGGLLGAITGKGGGMAAQGAPGQPAAPPGLSSGPSTRSGQAIPTVGQAIGPMLGKLAQMPLPQAVAAVKPIVGRLMGAPMPPQRPEFGQPQSSAGPRQTVPVRVPVPSVALQGRGGGVGPEVSRFAGTRADRNMNPGNIAFGDWARAHGATGAAGRDTGHGVAVFPTPQAGFQAMSDLALQKYGAGRRTADSLIAAPGGWTPGNHEAAANVARGMGIGPHDDLGLSDPGRMFAFQRSLARQEGAPNLLRQFSRGAQLPRTAPAQMAPSMPVPQPRPAAATAAPMQDAGPARKQPGARQQASAPPIPEPPPPQPPLEINTKPFQPPRPQQQEAPAPDARLAPAGSRASNLNQGVPTIDHPDKLKGMKPGSLFRAPDGRLKIIPLAQDAR